MFTVPNKATTPETASGKTEPIIKRQSLPVAPKPAPIPTPTTNTILPKSTTTITSVPEPIPCGPLMCLPSQQCIVPHLVSGELSGAYQCK